MKIDQELFGFFEKAGTTINYHSDDIIYMQEDEAQLLYLIKKGRVRVYVINSSGEEVTLEILDRGRIFGESSFIQNYSRPTTTQSINEVELIACRLDDLYPYLSESKELTVALLQLMAHTCDYLSSLVKKAYTFNRYEKVADFLLEQTIENHPYKDIIDDTLPYTHEEIASILGLSRVTVSKILSEFHKKGYILSQYKKIKILSRESLSQVIQKK